MRPEGEVREVLTCCVFVATKKNHPKPILLGTLRESSNAVVALSSSVEVQFLPKMVLCFHGKTAGPSAILFVTLRIGLLAHCRSLVTLDELWVVWLSNHGTPEAIEW